MPFLFLEVCQAQLTEIETLVLSQDIRGRTTLPSWPQEELEEAAGERLWTSELLFLPLQP